MFRYLCLLALIALASAVPVDEMATEAVPNETGEKELRMQPAVDEDITMPESETRAPHIGIMDAGMQQSTDGAYNFYYRGEDGSFRQESAVIMNPGTEDQFLKISGSYSYFDADGKEVVVNYNADDRGFVPEGNNILPSISLAAKQNSQLPRLEEKPIPHPQHQHQAHGQHQHQAQHQHQQQHRQQHQPQHQHQTQPQHQPQHQHQVQPQHQNHPHPTSGNPWNGVVQL